MSQLPNDKTNPAKSPEDTKRLKKLKKKKKTPPESGGAINKTSNTTSARLVSLDAYRGFIMIMLAGAGFGIFAFSQKAPTSPVWDVMNYDFWQHLGFQFAHPPWISQFNWVGVAFWDLIQPAFMFMVGVAMPFSYARRAKLGHTSNKQLAHAAWRAFVLVVIGVFLYSVKKPSTHWIFYNVLAQIGLGYFFLYLLMGQKLWIKITAFVVILVGYHFFFYTYEMPEGFDHQVMHATGETQLEGNFARWSKNANAAAHFDSWFLNLFPRPNNQAFVANRGGYATLSFIPSIATMLLGVFCGQLVRSSLKPWQILLYLILFALVCLGLGVAAGYYVCPIIKRIWTPSWVLYSGGWVIGILALFYLLFDVIKIKYISFPLIVVGMNSIAAYLLGQLLRPWTLKMIKIHFGQPLQWIFGPHFLDPAMYGTVVSSTLTFIIFWLILYWMYRQKFFVRV